MTDALAPRQGPRRRARFRDELADFAAFALRPRLGPRLPGASPASREWLGGISLPRLLRWVLVLWLVNLMVFGPLASGVADLAGTYNRLETMDLPWWKAVVLAPVLEEFVFRFFLRRPGVAAWFVPALLIGILARPRALAWAWALALALCLAGFLWIRLALSRRAYLWSWRAMRRYARRFPLILHASVLVFALLHLSNFEFDGGLRLWAALPLMVLPQWATGLVLAWMRVRFGIGASMVLHGLFNAGPMALLWLAAHYAPQMLT